MKKILMFCMLLLGLTGCSTNLESISIEGNNEIFVNTSSTLTIIKKPIDGEIEKVEWKSSDETIVKVEDGVIIGMKEGTATIIAKVSDDIKATKDIIVHAPTESIILDKEDLKLKLNEEQKINVTIEPKNRTYSFASENSSIATISSDGIIKAVNYGKTKIVVRSKDNKESICEVSVYTTVPDFSSMSASKAKKWGEDNQVTIYTKTEYSDYVKKDKIISQSIKAGTEINELGKSIEIIYSLGHKQTLGETNALASARSYLSVMSFSAKGLKEQLLYEGFSKSEAKYAVDNCGADWNEQAAKSAREYLSVMSFSRSGLKNQLIYEGFTEKQAEYGVKAVGY